MNKPALFFTFILGLVIGRWGCASSSSMDRGRDFGVMQDLLEDAQERVEKHQRQPPKRIPRLLEPIGDAGVMNERVVLKPGMLYDPDTKQIIRVPVEAPTEGIYLTSEAN